ncbi:Protein LIKE COV 2 [Coccomyxa sp. Obi]|nr:Protein LIKE COV 2 [Coccomyxa sp. Obi]
MLRAEAGTQGRAEPHGISRAESAPSRVDSTPEDAQDTELLRDAEEGLNSPKGRPAHARRTSTREALHSVLSSWVSRRFFGGCAVLFPMVITVYITWWFLTFFDNFFSPVYEALFGFHVFGLGFVTSMGFIIGTGVFVSSWLGGLLLQLADWIIKKLPLIKHVYSAAKQVSSAVNPANESTASFRECVLIRHPRHGEYAFAFITGTTVLQQEDGSPGMELFSVYVPTNHIYVGDIFLLGKEDVIHTNLSVREGLEIVVSVGMALPRNLTAYMKT